MGEARKMLRENDWKKIKPLLPKPRKDKKGRAPKDNRLVIEDILWMLRTEAPWRDLHPDFWS